MQCVAFAHSTTNNAVNEEYRFVNKTPDQKIDAI